jgi:RNA polymerase sigma factor for flagellar operon FliA
MPSAGAGDTASSAQCLGPNQEGEDPLSEIVRSYMPLVRHAVSRVGADCLRSSILQYEDMLSCGVQGLIEAYHSFDPNKGAKFSTYALPRIRGAILDALRAAHPLPRSAQKFTSDLEKAAAELHVRLGRSPTRQELAAELGLDMDEMLVRLKNSSVRILSLENLADMAVDGNSEKLWEMADEDPSIDPDAVAEKAMVKTRLEEALDTLPDRERAIVRLYYLKSRSLKSIGRRLGISESRASQLRHRAIRRLRVALADELQKAA